MFAITVPWPISANAYYTRGKSWISQKGRIWRDLAIGQIWDQTGGRRPVPLVGRVSLTFEIWMPDDRRRRDLDNYTGKHVIDMLTKSGVWEDDSQVWEIHQYRRGKRGRGEIRIEIKEI